jgi:2-polyprenyl-6-hydroxyphenyl methylase / 3-demethylubiquinone-9 3-methyltransferase
MARGTGLDMEAMTGMTYNPFTKVYSLVKDSSVNYIMVYRA